MSVGTVTRGHLEPWRAGALQSADLGSYPKSVAYRLFELGQDTKPPGAQFPELYSLSSHGSGVTGTTECGVFTATGPVPSTQ